VADDDEKRRRDLYDEHRRQTWQDIQSSTDNFDKNLLAVSSGALGFSLAFIKDIVHLPTATWHALLYTSWACFAGCIVVTVFSFRLSVMALNEHLKRLPKYYEDKQDVYLTETSTVEKMLEAFTWIAASLFLAGIISIVTFCMKNIR
jgi:anaerobic C4-dicarboxylate transporter